MVRTPLACLMGRRGIVPARRRRAYRLEIDHHAGGGYDWQQAIELALDPPV
jgi:hypothetical protein